MDKNKNLTFKDIDKFKEALIKSGNQQVVDLFTIILKTGLRLPQVLNMEFKDIDIESCTFMVEEKKSHKCSHKEIKINNECVELLEELQDKYPRDKFVFQSRKSNYQKNKDASPISRQTVMKAFKNASNRSSIPITTHSLRHAYVVNALKENLEEGNNSIELSTIIQHETLKMTNYYAELSKTEFRKILNSAKLSTSHQPDICEIKDYYVENSHEKNQDYVDDIALSKTINILIDINKNENPESIYKKYNISVNDMLTTIETIKNIRSINSQPVLPIQSN
jgi:hypothetical protein